MICSEYVVMHRRKYMYVYSVLIHESAQLTVFFKAPPPSHKRDIISLPFPAYDTRLGRNGWDGCSNVYG
jgi:hypothetical protein